MSISRGGDDEENREFPLTLNLHSDEEELYEVFKKKIGEDKDNNAYIFLKVSYSSIFGTRNSLRIQAKLPFKR